MENFINAILKGCRNLRQYKFYKNGIKKIEIKSI